MLRVEKITTREELERLEPVWNSLLERSQSNTLTLTWEWVSTWWDVFSEGRELYTLVVREDDEVIGIAPMLRRTIQHYGLLPFRRLEFLASGEDEADEICSEYLDFILMSGREDEALESIFNYLNEHQSEWDELLLTDILAGSSSLPVLRRLCEGSGTKLEEVRNQTCIYVALPADWETFFQSISPTFRQRIKKDRRKAAQIGASLKRVESAAEFEESFEVLIRLHQMRWTSRGEPGVFSSEKFTLFHKTLAPKVLPKGWIKLFVLTADGEPIAALYDFIYGNKMYYYQSGLNVEHDQIRSPGLLIRSYAIEAAIGLQLSECDFLKGDIKGYKAGWRGETRDVLQLRIARQQSKEAIYTATAKLFGGLRQIKRALRRAAIFMSVKFPLPLTR